MRAERADGPPRSSVELVRRRRLLRAPGAGCRVSVPSLSIGKLSPCFHTCLSLPEAGKEKKRTSCTEARTSGCVRSRREVALKENRHLCLPRRGSLWPTSFLEFWVRHSSSPPCLPRSLALCGHKWYKDERESTFSPFIKVTALLFTGSRGFAGFSVWPLQGALSRALFLGSVNSYIFQFLKYMLVGEGWWW